MPTKFDNSKLTWIAATLVAKNLVVGGPMNMIYLALMAEKAEEFSSWTSMVHCPFSHKSDL